MPQNMWGAFRECRGFDQNTWKCHHEVPPRLRVYMFLFWPVMCVSLWHQYTHSCRQGKFKSKIMIFFPLFYLLPVMYLFFPLGKRQCSCQCTVSNLKSTSFVYLKQYFTRYPVCFCKDGNSNNHYIRHWWSSSGLYYRYKQTGFYFSSTIYGSA